MNPIQSFSHLPCVLSQSAHMTLEVTHLDLRGAHVILQLLVSRFPSNDFPAFGIEFCRLLPYRCILQNILRRADRLGAPRGRGNLPVMALELLKWLGELFSKASY
jgi:hypothetical protein